jgi:AcrR family transcriptional regulator
MPKISAEAATQRRDQIVEAAEACFARHGFHATTIQHVIRESGLSAGCIYSYFESKDELVAAIAERRHARDTGLLAELKETNSPLAAVLHVARAFLEDLQTEEGLRIRQVGLQLWAEALRNETVRTQVVDGVRKPANLIASLIRRAIEAGELHPDTDARALARAIVALFQGHTLQRLWGEPLQIEAALAALAAMLRGFEMQSGSGRRVKRPNP